MNIFNKLSAVLALIALGALSSCAVGAATSATSGYAIKSQSADSLTAEAEQRIVDRTKREIMAEMNTSHQNCSLHR